MCSLVGSTMVGLATWQVRTPLQTINGIARLLRR